MASSRWMSPDASSASNGESKIAAHESPSPRMTVPFHVRKTLSMTSLWIGMARAIAVSDWCQ